MTDYDVSNIHELAIINNNLYNVINSNNINLLKNYSQNNNLIEHCTEYNVSDYQLINTINELCLNDEIYIEYHHIANHHLDTSNFYGSIMYTSFKYNYQQNLFNIIYIDGENDIINYSNEEYACYVCPFIFKLNNT